jgi:hypothetical protein
MLLGGRGKIMGRSAVHQPYHTADGRKVPSVTTILGTNLGWNKNILLGWTRKKMNEGIDPLRIRDFAGEVGTVAHGLIEQKLTGDVFNIYEYPSEAVTAAQIAYGGFEAFATTHELETEACEIPVVHEDLLYGGTIDWMGKLDGEPCMIDFKTSTSVHVDHYIQLCAYRELYAHKFGVYLERAYLLHLDKMTGNHTLHTLTNFDPYWKTFEILLELDKLRSEIGG